MKKENKQIKEITEEERLDEEYYFYLVDTFQPVFFEREGVSRVLGSEHPTVRLMEDAVKSLDWEKLEAAHAAYSALPEHILHKIYFPWIGCPPPPGTREKLRKKLIPELVGEAYGVEPVDCYLQIDARETGENAPWPADEDGHAVEPALVYDPGRGDWPVRVQILEGSNKPQVLELLKKTLDNLEQNWDKWTNPNFYSSIFPEDELPKG